MDVNPEFLVFGVEMGIKGDRAAELLHRAHVLGTTTGSNAAWVKAVADAPDMTPLEKTYLAFMIAGAIVSTSIQMKNMGAGLGPVQPNDPMFR